MKKKRSYSSQDIGGRGENTVFSARSGPEHAQCGRPTCGVLAIDGVDRGIAYWLYRSLPKDVQSELTVPPSLTAVTLRRAAVFGLPLRPMRMLDV